MFKQRRFGYAAAVCGVAVVTGALRPFGGQINPTTVALALLLVVLFVATIWGARPAVMASLLGVVCLNYFFLPPVGTLVISDPDNWVALSVFLITAITTGQLSARAKQRAEEAEAGRREVERLYQELQDTFERSSLARALKQSEKLKSALLDAVTHDLRTPLTAIKASVTTLLEELRPRAAGEEPVALGAEGRREMLEVIDEEADRLNRFIAGLVELARIEAGEMRLQRREGSLEEIMEAALERAAPLTRAHRLEVWFEDELPLVSVDPRAVAEIIYTLLDNAAKYSAPGTTIRVTAKPAGTGHVEVSVADEGRGVPTELRERVFEKFYRAMRDGDAGGKRPAGTGMGLAIARGIVEAHGGRIWIADSDGGRGARVVFTLPTGDADERAPESHEDAQSEQGAALSQTLAQRHE